MNERFNEKLQVRLAANQRLNNPVETWQMKKVLGL